MVTRGRPCRPAVTAIVGGVSTAGRKRLSSESPRRREAVSTVPRPTDGHSLSTVATSWLCFRSQVKLLCPVSLAILSDALSAVQSWVPESTVSRLRRLKCTLAHACLCRRAQGSGTCREGSRMYPSSSGTFYRLWNVPQRPRKAALRQRNPPSRFLARALETPDLCWRSRNAR